MSAKEEEFEKAVNDPALAYRTPEDVLADPRFDRDAKREILKSWELDARELAVAESENMGGGEPNMLTRVLSALADLADEEGASGKRASTAPKVPTMHGYSPRKDLP